MAIPGYVRVSPSEFVESGVTDASSIDPTGPANRRIRQPAIQIHREGRLTVPG